MGLTATPTEHTHLFDCLTMCMITRHRERAEVRRPTAAAACSCICKGSDTSQLLAYVRRRCMRLGEALLSQACHRPCQCRA